MPVLTKIIRFPPGSKTTDELPCLGWAVFPEAPGDAAGMPMPIKFEGSTEMWVPIGRNWVAPVVGTRDGTADTQEAYMEVFVWTLKEFNEARLAAAGKPGLVAAPASLLEHVNFATPPMRKAS